MPTIHFLGSRKVKEVNFRYSKNSISMFLFSKLIVQQKKFSSPSLNHAVPWAMGFFINSIHSTFSYPITFKCFRVFQKTLRDAVYRNLNHHHRNTLPYLGWILIFSANLFFVIGLLCSNSQMSRRDALLRSKWEVLYINYHHWDARRVDQVTWVKIIWIFQFAAMRYLRYSWDRAGRYLIIFFMDSITSFLSKFGLSIFRTIITKINYFPSQNKRCYLWTHITKLLLPENKYHNNINKSLQ